ncbi:MFS transporter [Streptomyces sp. M10(2022)]
MTGTPVALAIGTPLGSWLGSTVGWRWSFVAMSLLSIIVMIFAKFLVPDAPGSPPRRRLHSAEYCASPAWRPSSPSYSSGCSPTTCSTPTSPLPAPDASAAPARHRAPRLRRRRTRGSGSPACSSTAHCAGSPWLAWPCSSSPARSLSPHSSQPCSHCSESSCGASRSAARRRSCRRPWARPRARTPMRGTRC